VSAWELGESPGCRFWGIDVAVGSECQEGQMNPEQAFLDAIWESPDDDGPRLIYADWLEEQGNPRGQFIRIQCALAGRELEERQRRELERQEQELLAAHQQEWLGSLCSPRLRWRFHRGFIVAMQGMFRERAGRYRDYHRFFPSGQVRVLKRVNLPPAEVADLLTETGCHHHFEGCYVLLPRGPGIDVAFSVTGMSPSLVAVPRFRQSPPFVADLILQRVFWSTQNPRHLQ
jgi:uncharacterized protein (TIGR02996 family)